MLEVLPPELTLHILSYIPAYDLACLEAVCCLWRRFLEEHKIPIYRAAAVLHDIAHPGASLEDSKGVHFSSWLDDVTDWKTFCKQSMTSPSTSVVSI